MKYLLAQAVFYRRALATLVLCIPLPFFAGCGITPGPGTANNAISGVMHGGQQPVVGATIQLYAMGTTGDQSASTPLISVPVLTDANGNFNLAGTFTCPSPTAQVYILGTGGSPSPGVTNSSLALMATLGQCSQLAGSYITVNEVTTIGSVIALAPYMASYTAIGAGPSDLVYLTAAVNTASEYVNSANGFVPGPTLPTGYYASSTQINTLANSLAACINSGGNTGPTSLCGTLFSLATPGSGIAPADTIAAVQNIVANPTQNTTPIYNLATPAAPFQPTTTTAPVAFTFPIVPMVATPVISPSAGAYNTAQTISISDATPGALIFYTTDGSTPTASSTVYTGSFSVSVAGTIKAIATASGYATSSVASAAYTFPGMAVAASPSILPAAGTYTAGITITISSTTPSAAIYYTTDGSAPTIFNGTLYSGPFALSSSATVNAIAVASGDQPSPIGSAAYVLNLTGIVSTIYTGTLVYPAGVATANCSQPYISLSNAIVTPPGAVVIGTVGSQGYSTLNSPAGLVCDAAGNLYIADSGNNRVLKMTPAGISTVIAGGNGTSGSPTGNNGPAINAQLSGPGGLALDSAGNLYIADGVVRMVNPAGIISIVAGGGGNNGDGGPATSANFLTSSIAVDSAGSLYIVDSNHNSIRKVSPAGIISTIASNLTYPSGIAVDGAGNIYFSDGTQRVRMIAPSGTISTVIGTGTASDTGDAGPPALATLNTPRGIALDNANNLYIAEYQGQRVRKVTYQGGSNPTPTISPASGSYQGSVTVSVTGALGTGLLCTTDGTTPTTSSPACSSSYTFSYPSAPVTVRAISTQTGFPPSPVATATYTFTQLPQQSATPPSFSFLAYNASSGLGYYGITDTLSPSTIYYTMDGSTPTATHHSTWTAFYPTYFNFYPVKGGTNVLKAYTPGGASLLDSPIGSFPLPMPAAQTPYFTVTPGTYTMINNGDNPLGIKDTSVNSTIYYTTDGSTPTDASPVYNPGTALLVQGTVTINAIAGGVAWADSPMITGTYTATAGPLTAPGINFIYSSTPYATPQTVNLTAALGTKIYYTLDGSTPTTASTLYTAPLTIGGTTTLNAIAAASGFANSVVSTATLNFALPAPTITPGAGNYTTAQSVVLAGSSGASLYYTTDGSTPTGSSARYAAPITIANNATLKVIAINGGILSPVVSVAYTFSAQTPAFTLAPGTYNIIIAVGLTASTAGSSIFYTTDGTLPTTGSTLYTGPIPITTTTRVNALAAATGFANSTVLSGTYSLVAATPTLSSPAGTYPSALSVSLFDSTPSSAIYYTTDGSTPTTASTLYSAAINVVATQTIKSIAIAAGFTPSAVASATYTVTPPTSAAPTITPGTGTYSTPRSVNITATSGWAIYYTTNGSTPTTSSTLYTGSIPVSANETINAIAALAGSPNSSVATAVYTFATSAPAFSIPPNSYSFPYIVSMTSTTSGATIHYTLDGSAPTISSPVYSTAIGVTSTTPVQAIAVSSGYANSSVTSAVYGQAAATPTYSLPSPNAVPLPVVLSSATPGAAIYYTITTTYGTGPGTTPLTLYSSPITVGQALTINAYATASGYTTSGTLNVSFVAP